MVDDGARIPAEGGSRTDLVISNVKQMIATGELRAGDRLPIEKELSARWGVSRGSLREGVRALATLGVLETRQGDGTYVTQLDPDSLLSPLGFYAELRNSDQSTDLLAVRRVLESESASLAATRMTEIEIESLESILSGIDQVLESDDVDPEAFIDADAEFHRRIANASANPALAAMIGSLMTRTLRARLWRAITERDSLGVAHSEHRAILDALRTRDPERSRIRMASHLLGVEEFAAAHPSGPDGIEGTGDSEGTDD
ncbi:FadR/GntR family transcriptional regulator [Paramicrobacterium fandaimingii]|uniref:FadR/GntR family transcriptional regulator n=1 Tax=Paramicrobacterium fandaimingii TaxID=2708079 RepID=UPI001FD35DA1|nr:FadR/GntR family transcriptional regulator [Microbacterium fandaimingii]